MAERTHDRHEPTPPEGASGPLSIVALDDDADFLEYLRGTLERLGHEVRITRTAEAFFSVCTESLPEVVLLDVNMGATDGTEVLDRIRQRWPRLCVIVVTGFPSMDTMRETFKRAAFDYLPKPFSEADLERVLGQAAKELGLGQRPQVRLRAELGRRIRLARTDRGWTLKDLSEASGVSVSQLSAVERGTHLPSLESLLLIAEALDTPPSEWLASSGF
ncbi:MAG: response regulator [Phycisphaerales bacterium]